MALRQAWVIVLAQASLVACGGSAEESSGPPPAEENWTTLLSGDWTLPSGTEGYTCVRHTVTEDLYVKAFDAINPLGTHHTLLTMGEPDGPDGLSKCNAGTNKLLSAFGSGVGTNPLHFPPGVALRIPAGTQLLLNLHLFNTGGGDLSGTSGTRIQTMPASEVTSPAEGILAGTINLSIPAGQTKTTIGHCTMSSDVTLFAVAPHMHVLGVYEKVVAESATHGEVTLYDDVYDFNEQSYYPVEPLALEKGERVRVECTHQNDTDKPVVFGESTLSEMCFAGLYRYPADGSRFICVDGLTAPQ
jgi:hypothetical protein